MNDIVRAFNKWQKQPRYDGPDCLTLEDTKVVLPKPEEKKPERQKAPDKKEGVIPCTSTINR